MPSWKKVITSGSKANLASVTSSNGVKANYIEHTGGRRDISGILFDSTQETYRADIDFIIRDVSVHTIDANNTDIKGGLKLSGTSAGTDNTVLVLDSSNVVKTDEIDSRVWGNTLANLSNGIDNRVVTATDSNSLNGESGLTYDGSTLGVTGDINVSADISSSGAVTSSGLHIGADKGIAVNTVKAGQGLTRVDSNTYAYFTHYIYGQDSSVSGAFSGHGNSGDNHQWSNTLGSFNHDSTSDAAGGIEIGVSQITMSNASDIHPCYTVPFDCELVGFSGTLHRFGGSHMMSAGIFVAPTNFGNAGTTKMTLRAFATASKDSGGDNSWNQRNNHWEDLSQTYALSAGDKVWPAVHCGTENGDAVRAQMTIVFRHKLGLE